MARGGSTARDHRDGGRRSKAERGAVFAVFGAIAMSAACQGGRADGAAAQTRSGVSTSPTSAAMETLTALDAGSADAFVAEADAGAPDASSGPETSWLGVEVDPAVRFERTVRVPSRRQPSFAAELRVPAGWRVVGLTNGQYDVTLAYLAIAPDRSALAILLVFEPGIWHESLVHREVARWLVISGGVTAIDGWDPPIPIAIGAAKTRGARVLGRGVLGRAPAELWEVRRRFPSPESGRYALVVTGALARSAAPARRAELLACLATFAPTPE